MNWGGKRLRRKFSLSKHYCWLLMWCHDSWDLRWRQREHFTNQTSGADQLLLQQVQTRAGSSYMLLLSGLPFFRNRFLLVTSHLFLRVIRSTVPDGVVYSIHANHPQKLHMTIHRGKKSSRRDILADKKHLNGREFEHIFPVRSCLKTTQTSPS
jgi:hypothetical protein